jgi:lipopolysaccharide/colanic/teichoic acid biosynthesis glycosyltransferase
VIARAHDRRLPHRDPVDDDPPVPAGRPGPGKRLLDLALAGPLLALSLPLILLMIVLVKLTSRGPAIYAQVRSGRGGRPFRLYKVRSMVHDCEGRTGPRWSTPGDPRVTPLGRFLRRSHLDELPQLWNVIRGDMSLVGPRPERPEFVAQLEKVVPRYRERLLVRPGITGLAQVQLPPDTDVESVRRKVACDLYYLRHFGLGLDLRILVATAFGLLGIPFAVSRMLLRVPGGEPVQSAYRELADGAGAIQELADGVGAISQVQPA